MLMLAFTGSHSHPVSHSKKIITTIMTIIIIIDRTLSHVIYILFIKFAVVAIAVTLTEKQLPCIGCKLNLNENEAIVE